MNDFSEIENELKKLTPARPSVALFARVEKALADAATDEKIVRPHQFRWNWLWLGTGLAAAAVILVFLRIDLRNVSQGQGQVAETSPVARPPAASLPATLIPAGATQVVYHQRDEGLFFPVHAEQPLRRVHSATQETLQWRNPTTGASLRITYPTERVELIPISGQ